MHLTNRNGSGPFRAQPSTFCGNSVVPLWIMSVRASMCSALQAELFVLELLSGRAVYSLSLVRGPGMVFRLRCVRHQCLCSIPFCPRLYSSKPHILSTIIIAISLSPHLVLWLPSTLLTVGLYFLVFRF